MAAARNSLALSVLALVAIGCACVWGGRDTYFDAQYEKFRSIKVDVTEDDVRKVLGVPTQVYDAATAPSSYYVEGYAFRPRPITNKVLIYVAIEPIAYYYRTPCRH